jgi:3-deoxy-manno-octulosonate cytidylyltransferase (CMP-KDO synthetase)
VCDDEGRALYFSRAPIPYLREDAESTLRDGLLRQHVGVYAYTRAALAQWVAWPPHPLERVERLEQLRPLAHGLRIGVAECSAAEAGIDTEDDLIRANQFWTEQQHLYDAAVIPAPLPHSLSTSSLGNA